jgi:hypothetical protein
MHGLHQWQVRIPATGPAAVAVGTQGHKVTEGVGTVQEQRLTVLVPRGDVTGGECNGHRAQGQGVVGETGSKSVPKPRRAV